MEDDIQEIKDVPVIVACTCGHTEKTHMYTARQDGGVCLACTDCTGFEKNV